jgi:hypothetical protein
MTELIHCSGVAQRLTGHLPVKKQNLKGETLFTEICGIRSKSLGIYDKDEQYFAGLSCVHCTLHIARCHSSILWQRIAVGFSIGYFAGHKWDMS